MPALHSNGIYHQVLAADSYAYLISNTTQQESSIPRFRNALVLYSPLGAAHHCFHAV